MNLCIKFHGDLIYHKNHEFTFLKNLQYVFYDTTIDWENFVVKKVMWDKSLMRFNFVKAESIVFTNTEKLCC